MLSKRSRPLPTSAAPAPGKADDLPWWRKHGLAPLVPLFTTTLVSASQPRFYYNLKAPVNIYDEGLVLTLSRFSTFGYLPYRDLWTLYGPAQSLLGPILNLIIGRSLLGHRIINIIMLEAVVILTYLLCSKFIARSSAAVFATVIGLLTLPLSYLTALLFLLPGMYLAFFPHEGASTRNRSCQREIAGMVLIGCSLLGRLECGLLALWAVLVFICFSWKDNTRSRIAMVSLACLAPGLLFVIYLAFIPVETLVENFLRFPLHYYPLVGVEVYQ